MHALTRRFRLLVGHCVLRRQDSVFSSEHPCSDEKIPFSRRRTRAPARRLQFLVGEGAFPREDFAFSPERTRSDQKIPLSGRRMRAPTKRLHFLVDGRVLRKSSTRIASVRPL